LPKPARAPQDLTLRKEVGHVLAAGGVRFNHSVDVTLAESPLRVVKFNPLGFAVASTYGWHVSEQQAGIIAQLCDGVLWLPDRDKHAEVAAHVGSWRHTCGCQRYRKALDDPEYLTTEEIRNLT
jgi:hypothetical protein